MFYSCIFFLIFVDLLLSITIPKIKIYFQFVVVKFLKTNNEDSDNDEIEYEVGRTKWLVDFNNNNDYIDKTLMILWPPKSSMVCNAVKMDKNPDSSWRTEQVQVKKFYSMF